MNTTTDGVSKDPINAAKLLADSRANGVAGGIADGLPVAGGIAASYPHLCHGAALTAKAGCTEPGAINYDADAVADDGSCAYVAVRGCIDPTATNFNRRANVDDGSCVGGTATPAAGGGGGAGAGAGLDGGEGAGGLGPMLSSGGHVEAAGGAGSVTLMMRCDVALDQQRATADDPEKMAQLLQSGLAATAGVDSSRVGVRQISADGILFELSRTALVGLELARLADNLDSGRSVLFVMPLFKDCRAQEATLCQIDVGVHDGPPIVRPCAAPSQTAVLVTGAALLCLVMCACVGVLLAYRTLCAARRTKARKRARARKKREAAKILRRNGDDDDDEDAPYGP